MRIRSIVRAGLIAMAWPAVAAAAPSLSAGHRLVVERCGRCHAVDRQDQSPNPRAPRFRDLGSRYPFGDLRDALAHQMIVGHPEMPVMVLTQREIQDLVAYLETLQTGDRVRRPAARPDV